MFSFAQSPANYVAGRVNTRPTSLQVTDTVLHIGHIDANLVRCLSINHHSGRKLMFLQALWLAF